MEMDADKLIEIATDQQFETTELKVERDQLATKLPDLVAKLGGFVIEQLNLGHVAQANLLVADSDTVFRLETNVINLPLRYANAISKIMSGAGTKPLNVYMVVESPMVNRSSLRIDLVAPTETFSTEQFPTIEKWMTDQCQKIEDNLAAAKEQEAEAEK